MAILAYSFYHERTMSGSLEGFIVPEHEGESYYRLISIAERAMQIFHEAEGDGAGYRASGECDENVLYPINRDGWEIGCIEVCYYSSDETAGTPQIAWIRMKTVNTPETTVGFHQDGHPAWFYVFGKVGKTSLPNQDDATTALGAMNAVAAARKAYAISLADNAG